MKGPSVREYFKIKLAFIWTFVVLMGPGIITSTVDNDAGGITTYSMAGAHFGLGLVWSLIPITLLLIIIQEMGARMGAVSGKGLSDLIRERFGVRVTFYTMILLLINNLGNTLANFAGVAASLEIFGISRYLSIPFSILFLMWLVVKGTYGSVEKVFLTACLFYVAYIVAGVLVQPDWGHVLQSAMSPSIRFESSYLVLLVGLVGTTIAPWMQFYLQASIVDKGLGAKDLRAVRLDVIIGSISVSVIAFFIILACAETLNRSGIRIEEAEQAARALEPIAGKYCSWLFAFGLFNASMFAASILPLSTSYTVCEAFGWESSVDKNFSQAPQFFGIYCCILLVSGFLILLPGMPLVDIMFVSQVLNGLVLPIVLILMIRLVNDRGIMKEHTNGPFLNLMSWTAIVVLLVLSGAMLIFLVLPRAYA